MNIDNVIARAQKLMLDEDWNRQVEIGAAAQRASSINGNGNSSDLRALERMALGTSAPVVPEGYERNEIQGNRVKVKTQSQLIREDGTPIQILSETPTSVDYSKLPPGVRESFEKTPSPSPTAYGYDMPPASYYSSSQQSYQQPRQVISETAQPQSSVNGINYDYIKYLVEEAVKKYAGNINESAGLNEFRGMRIGNGSVIQFLDSKGNLYEGKLVLKKKAQK